MASFTFVLIATLLLVAACRAAPKNSKQSIKLPEECQEKDFCSIRPEGYDEIEAKINSLLPPYMTGVDDRFGDGIQQRSDDNDNCPSLTTWESVYAYKNPKGTKMDIIVQTKLFPQRVIKVNCLYGNSKNGNLRHDAPQCFRKLGLDHFNMKFSCQQSTASRTLLVYDPEAHRLKMKNYTLPVCCSCQIDRP